MALQSCLNSLLISCLCRLLSETLLSITCLSVLYSFHNCKWVTYIFLEGMWVCMCMHCVCVRVHVCVCFLVMQDYTGNLSRILCSVCLFHLPSQRRLTLILLGVLYLYFYFVLYVQSFT